MGKKILVADDDPVLTRILSSYLGEYGFEVVVAHDGDEALRKLEQEHPDLIILDVVMPRVNGYAFLFAMRKIEGVVKTPIIVLTCKPELVDIFMAEGVQEYFIKPFPQRELLEKVRKYI
ncbi:MAG: response regulator transcription factor [Candidatus Omnitrophica bacterium]|nr:response regulator transcription factor [Candidatus Omnitrophota bacterium]